MNQVSALHSIPSNKLHVFTNDLINHFTFILYDDVIKRNFLTGHGVQYQRNTTVMFPALKHLKISTGYLCVAQMTTRLPSSVIQPSNCNNLRILLVYSRHTDSRVLWGHLRQTYCQHSLHRQTLLLVGSHAASPPFGTVFLHLYALLTVSLVLGLSSRLTCSQDICSRSAVHASDTFTRSLVPYQLSYLLT